MLLVTIELGAERKNSGPAMGLGVEALFFHDFLHAGRQVSFFLIKQKGN